LKAITFFVFKEERRRGGGVRQAAEKKFNIRGLMLNSPSDV
jgi:hypothetical protein